MVKQNKAEEIPQSPPSGCPLLPGSGHPACPRAHTASPKDPPSCPAPWGSAATDDCGPSARLDTAPIPVPQPARTGAKHLPNAQGAVAVLGAVAGEPGQVFSAGHNHCLLRAKSALAAPLRFTLTVSALRSAYFIASPHGSLKRHAQSRSSGSERLCQHRRYRTPVPFHTAQQSRARPSANMQLAACSHVSRWNIPYGKGVIEPKETQTYPSPCKGAKRGKWMPLLRRGQNGNDRSLQNARTILPRACNIHAIARLKTHSISFFCLYNFQIIRKLQEHS